MNQRCMKKESEDYKRVPLQSVNAKFWVDLYNLGVTHLEEKKGMQLSKGTPGGIQFSCQVVHTISA
jgi:hypothetical protein